jgi:hypothetical protein
VARAARVQGSRRAASPSEALVGGGLRQALQKDEGAAEAAAGRARKDCGRGLSPLSAAAARQDTAHDDMLCSSPNWFAFVAARLPPPPRSSLAFELVGPNGSPFSAACCSRPPVLCLSCHEPAGDTQSRTNGGGRGRYAGIRTAHVMRQTRRHTCCPRVRRTREEAGVDHLGRAATAAGTRRVRLGWAALTPGDVRGMWACEFAALRSADVVVERLYKVRSWVQALPTLASAPCAPQG